MNLSFIWPIVIGLGSIFVFYVFIFKIIGLTIIANDKFGVVERWLSGKGSVVDGIVALKGEAGFLPDVLRGGIHFRSRIFYKIHLFSLITIPQGQMAYVFARSGNVLPNEQLLGRVIEECDYFQKVTEFLEFGGQKGPQRQIIREGTYAINLAQFVVITKDEIHYLRTSDRHEYEKYTKMQNDLEEQNGFEPVTITATETKDGNISDIIGVVRVLDGPPLKDGDIIAPVVGNDIEKEFYHSNFQDPEKFLAAGGMKGIQNQTLADGTYFINRLFASIERYEKMQVPIGYVAVVNSFTGSYGEDTSGEEYKHGQLVSKGMRGIWNEALLPGKYSLNPYAVELKLVPTTNVILKWKDGEAGNHKLDESLSEVDMITKDAFEPTLSLSVVLHVDYKKAPLVIQRFGDMKQLVNQTLDPMISSYFKNEGQSRTLIELIQSRKEIQEVSTIEMKAKFANYNLELEEVLIGTPVAKNGDTKIVDMLKQLTDRQIAIEQIQTYKSKQIAAENEKLLNEAEAVAAMQSELTKSKINIEVQYNAGCSDAKRSEQDAIKIKNLAEAEANKIRIIGTSNAEIIELKGKAEAVAIEAQVNAYGGPEYQYKDNVQKYWADAMAVSKVDVVPKTVVNMGGDASNGGGFIETLAKTLTLEHVGVSLKNTVETEPLNSDLELAKEE